jgi:hypothetical protein
MCEYSELRIPRPWSDKGSVQAQELKSLVESGHYKPDPSRVAAAMLRRRGVREFLTLGQWHFGPTGRTPPPASAPRRAA